MAASGASGQASVWRAFLPSYLLSDVMAVATKPSEAAVLSGPHPDKPGSWRFSLSDADGDLTRLVVIGGRHYRDRFPWPLGDKSAVVTRLWTRPDARGRGLAAKLLADAAAGMADEGIEMLYAMVWWSNRPSHRALAAAGWWRAAWHLTLQLGKGKPLDLVWRTAAGSRLAGAGRAAMSAPDHRL